MMVRRRFDRPVRAVALLGELQAAGVRVGTVNPFPTYTEIDLEEADYDRAAAVVAAHDLAAVDTREAAAAQRARDDWAILKGYLALTAAPTVAQRLAWERAITRAVGRLTREIADDG